MDQLPLPIGHARSKAPQQLWCVYCGSRLADSRDHVPPKVLLEKPLPNNLRTVPSCRLCNEGWSLDEEYTVVALAQVGIAPHLTAKVLSGGSVDRALSTSPALDDRIIGSLSVADDGRVWFAPEKHRIARVAGKIAFGLYCLRYGLGHAMRSFETVGLYGPGDEVPEQIIAAQHIWPGARRKRWTVVQQGVFSFVFAKGWMATDPPLFCMINFHETLFAVVACPAPIGRGAKRRLRDKPWS